MGLISFLKNKFGKKKEPENQAKTEVKSIFFVSIMFNI